MEKIRFDLMMKAYKNCMKRQFDFYDRHGLGYDIEKMKKIALSAMDGIEDAYILAFHHSGGKR